MHVSWKRQLAALAGCLAVCGLASAQVDQQTQPKPTVVPATPAQSMTTRTSDAKVPLIDGPLKLQDFAGMEPRADLRDKLTRLHDFIQNAPKDGAPATEKTEVWLGRTNSTLYIVFLCFDSHPELIRSHLARRENILKDDYVTVVLDPFQDKRIGVEFQVNPAGVQADAAWSEANGNDYSYDQVWDSDARITKQGWMAMIALPFRSLRFPENGKDWGAVFYRNFPRNSENDWWPRVSANVSGMLSQEGTLHGITGVTGSHNIQINPYALGQSEKTLNTLDPTNPYFSSRKFEGTAGGEAKAIIKDQIVVDVTVNPDFSDVESDQPQFTVNQRYPVYFPELRPFFLENANYFATPLQLLYTRNIIRPEFGARVTGKIGKTSLGLLAIDDRSPGEIAPVGDPLHGQRAGFFVGRVAQDDGKGSNVGAMYTDEEFGGGWNRIGGLDFTWRANSKWTVFGQMVESSTHENDPKSATLVFPPGYSAGPASYFEVNRSAHAFNLDSAYTDYSTGFQSLVGFVQSSDFRTDHTHATYQWFPKHSVVQSIGLETNQNIAFDHQGNRVFHYSTFDPFVLLPRNIVMAPLGGQNSDSVGPQNGYAFPHTVNFTENFGGFVARGQPWSIMNFNVQALRSGNVNYYPVAGGVPFLLREQSVQALVSVNPLKQLTMDNTYLLDRNFDSHTNEFVYESQTMRTKINYQFTQALSARVIVEYDSTLANPVKTSLQRTKQVQTQALLTWLPHPGTSVYIGYNGDLQNLDHTLCSRLAGGKCDPGQPILPRSAKGYLGDGRQLFVKASYLFRF